MTDDDLVNLVVVMKGGHVISYYYTRKQASDIMRAWYDARERYAKLPLWKRLYLNVRYWGAWASIATNRHNTSDPGKTWACMVAGWEHVIGMYAYDNVESQQEKFFRAHLEEHREGEEWKGDDEE